MPGDVPGDPLIDYVVDLQEGEEHIFAMKWSPRGDLWFAGSRSDGELSLHRYDPATGEHKRWELPGEGNPGPYTFLLEHGDGSWWVAANYTVWRFDPHTATAAIHEVLDPGHPLRDPAADDPDSPLPGTWINGMAATDGGVEFTRNNVPALFRVDAAGTISIERELADSPAGLTVVNGKPIPVREVGQALASEAKANSGLAGVRGVIYADGGGCKVTLIPEAGSVVANAHQSSVELAASVVPYDDQAAVSAGGEYWTAALSENATILRGNCRTGEIEQYQLPVRFFSTEEPDPFVRGGHHFLDMDRPYVARKSTILAVAVNDAGQVAFSDDGMRIAIIE